METVLFEPQDEHLSPVQEEFASQQGEFRDIAGEATAEKEQLIPEITDNGHTYEENKEKQILGIFQRNHIEIIDKREKGGGAIWAVGGFELQPIMKEIASLGMKFHFKEKGGRVTKKRPGWWAK